MSASSKKATLGKKLDQAIADLSKLASTANRGCDFKVAMLAQEAIGALGLLRARGREDGDLEWADWIAWPPRIYPPGHDSKGLVDVSDVDRLAQEKLEEQSL
jgi:hypothetical protein